MAPIPKRHSRPIHQNNTDNPLKSKSNPFLRRSLVTAAADILCIGSAYGQTYYFDVNDTTVGSGVAEAGSYNWQGAFWDNGENTGDAGTSTRTWANGSNANAVFVSTADAGSTNYTVTLPGGYAQTWVKDLTVNSGNLSISNAFQANFVLDDTSTWTVATGSSLSINSSGEVWRAVNMNGSSLILDIQGSATANIAGLNNSPGSVTKNGSGTLTLTDTSDYSGTTNISGGTLALQGGGGGGTNYNGGDLNINGAATLRVNGERYNFTGETFTFDSVGGGTIDAIASGAGGFVFTGNNTFATSVGAQNILSGTKNGAENQGLNLNSSSAIFNVTTGSDTTSDLKVIGTIWNGGNVTKNGVGRLEISAPQQYSGTTTVNDGTLILGDGTNNVDLSNSHDVVVESGTTLRLNYLVGNSDSIDELWLGGVQQSPGIYGAGTYSGVTITGTGTLNVLTGPPITDPFANWMSTNYSGILTPDNEPGADPDNDGIDNLMEYVLQGGDPSISTTGTLPTVNASGLNFVFTYYRRAAATTSTTQNFEYSTTLGAGSWTPVAIPGGAGVTVTPDTPSAGIDKVEIIVAKGANTKLFGRLQVVK